MRFYWLVLAVLAIWRLTFLLQAEDGPWDMVLHLRRRLGDSYWGKLMDCFYCLSLWIAAPFAIILGEGAGEILLLWPALSGGAILLHRATGGGATEIGLQRPYYYEEQGVEHGMLRRPETEPVPYEQERTEARNPETEN